MAAPASAAAESDSASIATGIGATAIGQFYDARDNAPIWLAAGDDHPARALITLLATSDLDGLSPASFDLRGLNKAVERATSGDRDDVARADRNLSEAFLRYVADLRNVGSSEWTFVDQEAAPPTPQVSVLLREAAATGSLDQFLATMPWMHQNYAPLRQSLANAVEHGDRVTAERLRINLERTRLLPSGTARYILVNTAAQKLDMYENGHVVDSMRVVVGKPEQQTPMLAALIRYAAVNPYWNVPADLTAERIAPNVVKDGLGYLKDKGYVVLSDWSEQATPVDPATIDWKAVADGSVKIRVRQDPGAYNAMGRMKFMFPNKAGVYLHDTPQKDLLKEEARMFSGGCVRLEDAARLGKWLYGHPLAVTKEMEPEHRIDLDRPVPVYLAYLTAVPSGGETVYYNDSYGRDQARLASAGLDRLAAR